MRKVLFGMWFLITFAPVVVSSVKAQDDLEVIEISPIEELAIEAGTGEIRGYGQGTSASEQLARQIAEAQARVDLQKQLETSLRYGFNQYIDQTSVGAQSSVDEKVRQDVVVAAKGIMEGVTILKTRKLYSKSTRKYKYEVCVKYDKASILNAMEQQNERILQNKERFETDMQDFWDELDEINGRKTVAEKRAEREARLNEMEQSNLDRDNQRTIDREKVRGKNAIGLEKARSKNYADEEARDEARKDREALRKAAASKNTSKERIIFETEE
ncbi:MAG: hypothetical protein J6X10_05960 [Bacteroidales bacterium]|nr:hypothetical protein [Bacteroidales bacterium]